MDVRILRQARPRVAGSQGCRTKLAGSSGNILCPPDTSGATAKTFRCGPAPVLFSEGCERRFCFSNGWQDRRPIRSAKRCGTTFALIAGRETFRRSTRWLASPSIAVDSSQPARRIMRPLGIVSDLLPAHQEQPSGPCVPRPHDLVGVSERPAYEPWTSGCLSCEARRDRLESLGPAYGADRPAADPIWRA